jgi:hypothetical protein
MVPLNTMCTTTPQSSANDELSAAATAPEEATKPTHNNPLKGILKQMSPLVSGASNSSSSSTTKPPNSSPRQRRSLFPTYKTTVKANKNLKVTFSPMAGQVLIDSLATMTPKQKAEIWWQHNDYEEFRKTARMIGKAMLEGGSEVWLANNKSWQIPNQDSQSTLLAAYQMSNKRSNTMIKTTAASPSSSESNNESSFHAYEEARNKWWCKFGHSRRGLEHVASVREGRQRQENINKSVRAVVAEHKRLKQLKQQQQDDAPEALRRIYTQYTTWPRNLARAAGSSDADAVKNDFDDDTLKTRDHYLSQILKLSDMEHHEAPEFIQAILGAATLKKPTSSPPTCDIFDANSASQARYRQRQQKRAQMKAQSAKCSLEQKSQQDKEESSSTLLPAAPHDNDRSSPDLKMMRLEEVHDPEQQHQHEGTSPSLAKRAAGFADGEEVESMATVLTGQLGTNKSKHIQMIG